MDRSTGFWQLPPVFSQLNGANGGMTMVAKVETSCVSSPLKASSRVKRSAADRAVGRPPHQSGNHTSIRAVEVPQALLFTKRLSPAAKLLWIRMRFDVMRGTTYRPRARLLAKRTGLGRSTVYWAIRRGMAEGWFVQERDPAGRERWKAVWPHHGGQRVVRIPIDLIRATQELRPQAILCYGILRSMTEDGKAGTFTWTELKEATKLHLRTIKRAVLALAEARWITLSPRRRRHRVQFQLQHPDDVYRAEVRRHLERADFAGEALMRSYLSLIVKSRESVDRARPEFLVNPASGERMEFDRFYPVHRVAFEFNGMQHYVASERFTRQEVEAQKSRDRLKREICKEKGICLVVVRAQDLSMVGMVRKVGRLLPRRAFGVLRRTIRYLDFCSRRYREAALVNGNSAGSSSRKPSRRLRRPVNPR